MQGHNAPWKLGYRYCVTSLFFLLFLCWRRTDGIQVIIVNSEVYRVLKTHLCEKTTDGLIKVIKENLEACRVLASAISFTSILKFTSLPKRN